jgi:hypothetical protein
MRSSESIVLEEGGEAKDIQITSTIPILCQDPSSECCLELEATVVSGSLRCPDASEIDRVEVGHGGCKPKICREHFNTSVSISVRARDDHIFNGDDELTVRFRVSDDSGLWDHVKIPEQKVCCCIHCAVLSSLFFVMKCFLVPDPRYCIKDDRVLQHYPLKPKPCHKHVRLV